MLSTVKLSRTLSVVIPAYNEENYIAGLLEDLTTQLCAKNIAIYIADGGSTDKTVAICQSYSDRLNLAVITGGSVTVGRNAGLSFVETEYVLFIDADVRLTSNLQLLDTWTALKNYRLVGCHVHSASGFSSRFAHAVFNTVNRVISLFRPFAVGAFFGVRTQDMREFGGWDETLIHGEDWVLSGKYPARDFHFCKHAILVDDRRLKKTGYWGMAKLLILSAWKGEKYMRADQGYWK